MSIQFLRIWDKGKFSFVSTDQINVSMIAWKWTPFKNLMSPKINLKFWKVQISVPHLSRHCLDEDVDCDNEVAVELLSLDSKTRSSILNKLSCHCWYPDILTWESICLNWSLSMIACLWFTPLAFVSQLVSHKKLGWEKGGNETSHVVKHGNGERENTVFRDKPEIIAE